MSCIGARQGDRRRGDPGDVPHVCGEPHIGALSHTLHTLHTLHTQNTFHTFHTLDTLHIPPSFHAQTLNTKTWNTLGAKIHRTHRAHQT